MNAEAYLHIVMDAYRGDVVSLPGKLDVVDGRPHRSDGEGCESLVTVRMEAGAQMPDLPHATSWHVRFVGPNRALDARTSDGTLKSLRWDGGGFTATLDASAVLASLDVGREVAASRVTHVLVVPEPRDEG